MTALPVTLKCTYCGAEEVMFLYPPVELVTLILEADRQAQREGWKIRRPARWPPVQICPKCIQEGRA